MTELSPTATDSRAPRVRASYGAAVTVALGLLALMLRTQVLALPDSERVVALASVYSAILAGSLLVPVRSRDAARMAPPAVLAIGLGAVILAAMAAGRPAASSFAPLALPLSLLAAVAEEALFRRAAYGWLEGYGAAVAVLGSATLFALIHVPLYGVAAFPVDLGAGLLFSWQRWASGRWEVSATTHAAANFLAVMMR